MSSLSAGTKFRVSLFLNLSIIVMELIALVQSVGAHGLSLFQYYTEDSNIFALLTSVLFCAFLLINRQNKPVPSWLGLIKYMSVCCLSVTFVVVITVLAPVMGGVQGYSVMLFRGSMLYHHFLCPVVAVVSFIFFDPLGSVGKKDTLFSLLPTLCYAIITTVLNVAKLLYGPYPFLHVYEQPVFVSCIWFVVILGMAYLLSWLLRIGFQRLNRAEKPRK